mgnify:CR=1 FL=1
MSIPADLKYTREHEWVKDNGDGTVTIGITDFAQGELGDIVFVELEPEGTEVDKDDTFGTVEAVKTVSYGDGWMVKFKLADDSQLDDLLSAEEYEDVIA